jgi:mannose-1-phosphate guanylyltransferase
MTQSYGIIIAGGAGTRFWPASRRRSPKQLLALAGDPNEPLLASTVRRLAPLIPPERVFIATGALLSDATAQVIPQVPRAHILAEPVPRNTAACIGWATLSILRKDPEALIAVLPSDHFIRDEPRFLSSVEAALELAKEDYLVTIGIVPERPETGYGYIELGEKLSPRAFVVSRFVEKPDRARALAFVAGGKHLWNAGMFFFRGRAMVEAIRRYMPDLYRGLHEIEEAAARGAEHEVLAKVFEALASISIDHGIMEKADRIAVVTGDFGWNDVGSWESAWELAAKDASNNAVPKDSIVVDARGNYICDRTTLGGKRVYALVGVTDLVLVETDDAVLLIPRERSQDVREVVEQLRARDDKSRL